MTNQSLPNSAFAGTGKNSKKVKNVTHMFLNSPYYQKPTSIKPRDIIRFTHSHPLAPIPILVQAEVVQQEEDTLTLLVQFSSRKDLYYAGKRLTRTLPSLVSSQYVKLIRK